MAATDSQPTNTPDPEPQGLKGPEPSAVDRRIKVVKEVVKGSLERWGSGVPMHIREQMSKSGRFDKFTERAKRVLVLAQEEARRMEHNYVGTEHILLGLIAEGNGVGAKILGDLDIGLDQARQAVEFVVGRGDKSRNAEISLTPRAKRVIDLSIQEARTLGHNFVGTEHLLIGLVAEGEGVAAGILEQMGATADRVRSAVIAAVGQGSGSTTKDNVVTCRIAAEDLAALDMLVEAGIRSTRSDAAQWLIHAGITANRSLFDEVAGTVSQIRQLRDQAREAAQRLAGERSGEE